METTKQVKSKAGTTPKKSTALLDFNHIKRFSIVTITTLIVVLLFVAFGFWIDSVLQTKPWLLVTSLIISFPIAQLIVYRQMRHYTKKEYTRLNIIDKN